MGIAQVNSGDRILASDLNAYYNLLKGVAASGESVTLIYNAAGVLVLQPSSDPAALTQSIQIKNNAGTLQLALTSDGQIVMNNAASRIIPGATSFSVRDNANANDNLLITNAGVVTVRSTLTVQGASVSVGTNPATLGTIRVPNNSIYYARNAANTSDLALMWVDSGDVYTFANGNIAVPSASGAVNMVTGPLTVGGAGGGKVIVAGTLTAGGLLGSAVQVGTSGPLIYSGSGVPTISAAVKGSLYLRTDGTGVADRIYVAKDTAGAWASLTAAS